MAIHIMREYEVEKLFSAIGSNESKYRSNKVWLTDLAKSKSIFIKTNVVPMEPLELLLPEAGALRDIENSIRLHKALRNLTPVQARDPRLWTRLTHVEFWPYMRTRWDVDRFKATPAKIQSFITARYFVAQNQSRALLRNGVARLWWYGHVTYDASRENPYELTKILLNQLDITQQILERNLGRAPTVLNGFLEFLSRHADELLGSGDKKRIQIRHLAKHLNLYGGTTLLDCLNKTDIISILEDEYGKIVAKPELLDAA